MRQLNNIKDLIAWIVCQISELYYISTKKPLYWWTFNGLKFDYVFILEGLTKFGIRYKSYGMGR